MSRWSRFVDFLNAEEDARPLALVRVLCASAIAIHVARFALSGAARVALIPQDQGGLSAMRGWLEHLGGATPERVELLCAVCVVAAVLSALGLLTRPSLIVTWLSFRCIGSLNSSARGSYDSLLVDILVVLILSGCGNAWSLDARRRGEARPAKRWPRVLLIVQLALLYFGSGIGKASSTWVPGGDASALWFILQQPTWARFPGLPLWTYPLTQIATTTTWLFEITGPLLGFAILLEQSEPRARWTQRLKRFLGKIRLVEVYLVFGALMHLGIEATMEVGPFSFASLALYPAALGPERLSRFVGWLAPRLPSWARARG